MKKVYILSTLLLSSLMFGCSSKLNIEFTSTNEFNLGDNISSCSLIKKVNGKEVTQEMIDGNKIVFNKTEIVCGDIKTDVVGENTVIYLSDGKEYAYKYTVNDIKQPSIIANDEINIDLDEQFNLEEHVTFVDNSPVSYIVKGNVDTSTPGKYEVKIACKDEVGNYSEKNIWVNIGEGGETHSLNDNPNYAKDPNADKLIAEMNQTNPQNEEENIGNVEHESLNEEVVFEDVVVLDPKCIDGIYEIKAANGFQAIDIAMNEYQCLQAEAKPLEGEEVLESEERTFNVTCICSKNNALQKDNASTETE